MDLTKLVYEYEINNEEYVMCFDMKSIAVFKNLTGKSFLQASAKIGELDDEVILAFIASSLRRKETQEEPLGEETFNFNVMSLLFAFHNDVVEMVVDSMPRDTKKVKKKIQ